MRRPEDFFSGAYRYYSFRHLFVFCGRSGSLFGVSDMLTEDHDRGDWLILGPMKNTCRPTSIRNMACHCPQATYLVFPAQRKKRHWRKPTGALKNCADEPI